jgi:hypothetical protein
VQVWVYIDMLHNHEAVVQDPVHPIST